MKKEKHLKLRNYEKEAKEIAKWEREKARPRSNIYIIELAIIITVVYITDEIASQIGTQMKSEIANTLFSIFGEGSVGIMDALAYISLPFALLTIFYKPLADRFGRRLFLIINTFGMSLGMFVIFLSANIPVYISGGVIVAFFIPHDMQLVYIMESAPAKHRAKFYSAIKAIATLGIMLIPLFRRIFMTDITQWRMVYLVPSLIGFSITLLALLLMRETDSFIEHRLAYLRMTDEQREEAKQKHSAEGSQGGIGAAFKFVFAHKQLKWLFIVTVFIFLGAIITGHYQVIMTYGYANSYFENGMFATMDMALNEAGIGPVTLALFMFPLTSAFFQFIPGILADWLGRKPTGLITVITALCCFLLFYFGSARLWPPYIIGLLCGAFVGSFWSTGDILGGMMVSESAPTNLRASINAAQAFLSILSAIPMSIISIILIGIFGNSAVATICLILAIPPLTLALFFMFVKTHETKGIDINKVTGTEWD